MGDVAAVQLMVDPFFWVMLILYGKTQEVGGMETA
jgi:hypothetical protein